MSRDFWFLFSRELKLPGILLIFCILLFSVFSWKIMGYGIFACLYWVYLRFRDRMQKVYYFFLFLSEELIFRKRLNLTVEEIAIFLYNPCPFLIKRYCQGKKKCNLQDLYKGTLKKRLPTFFCKMAQTNQVNFETAMGVSIFYEMILPVLIGVSAYFVFNMSLNDVVLFIGTIYFIPLFIYHFYQEDNYRKMIWTEDRRIDEEFVHSVTKSGFDSQSKEWKAHYQKWQKASQTFNVTIPLLLEESDFEKNLSNFTQKENPRLLLAAYQNKELTAKQIYDQIDAKIEVANLTAQELWDLWAEYYFEGYEARE